MADITAVGIGLSSALSPQVIDRAKTAQTDPDKAKLQKTATEFEALLLGHWLEQAQQAFASVPGADDDEEGSDPGKSQFQSLGMQTLAQSITKSGGLGIAKMIFSQLQGQLGTSQATGDPKQDDQPATNLQVHEK